VPDEHMRLLFGHEDVANFEVAAPRGTQTGHPPGVVDHDIAAFEIATQRRLVLAAGTFHTREAPRTERNGIRPWTSFRFWFCEVRMRQTKSNDER